MLRELADAGADYAPFEGATMRRYAARLTDLDGVGPDVPAPSVTNVQQALRALQQRGLVWRASRGVYALEDGSVAGLMREAGLL